MPFEVKDRLKLASRHFAYGSRKRVLENQNWY